MEKCRQLGVAVLPVIAKLMRMGELNIVYNYEVVS